MAGLISLSKALSTGLSKRTANVLLLELNEKDDSPISTGSGLAFQYFPDTIQSNKNINYSPKSIPGGSLPLYQWSSSGEHHISFKAMFATDIDPAPPNSLDGTLGSAIPAAINQTNVRLKNAGEASRNIDIRSALVWLRRFMLPRYGADGANGTPLTYAPRKLILKIPNSGIGFIGGQGAINSADSILCIMTQCDINYISMFPNNIPRLVEVSLTFAEVAQYRAAVYFPSATSLLDLLTTAQAPVAEGFSGLQGTATPFLPYTLPNK